MNGIRVASVQLALVVEASVDQFLDHLDGLAALAVEEGADLVVFPEFASTGLLGSIASHSVTKATVDSDYWDYLPQLTPSIVDGLTTLSARHDVTILGGSHCRLAEDGTLRNTAYLVRPDGTVELQDKLHLTPPEHDLGARGGHELLVTSIGPFTAGVLVCADIQYPELSRWLVARGVDLILCPSLTWNRRGVNRIRTGATARANENQAYVVVSPLIGNNGLPTDGPMYSVGQALVAAPNDRNFGTNDGLVASLDGSSEGMLVADLDYDRLMESRRNPETPGLALRRLDLFARLRTEVE